MAAPGYWVLRFWWKFNLSPLGWTSGMLKMRPGPEEENKNENAVFFEDVIGEKTPTNQNVSLGSHRKKDEMPGKIWGKLY